MIKFYIMTYSQGMYWIVTDDTSGSEVIEGTNFMPLTFTGKDMEEFRTNTARMNYMVDKRHANEPPLISEVGLGA